MTAQRRVADTNVISYIFKGDSRAPLYRPHLDGVQPVISFQTLAELRDWALKSGWGARRKQSLRDFLRPIVVIHSDERICTLWAEVTQAARTSGRPIGTADAWIAATALALRCPLVTHNTADFAGVPSLKLISEPPQ